MYSRTRNLGYALGGLIGSVAGAWAGFALLFYGYLLFHPPGPGGTEFETASALAFCFGAPSGAIMVGSIVCFGLFNQPQSQ